MSLFSWLKKTKKSSNNDDLIKGIVAHSGKAQGKVKVVLTDDQVGKIQKGDILVTDRFSPLLKNKINQVAAIVTDLGGLTDHPAKIARELKTPCIVGTKNATQILKDGDMVEVDAEQGIVHKL